MRDQLLNQPRAPSPHHCLWLPHCPAGAVLPGPSQLMLAVVVAAAVTAARTALLAAWPEFKEASDRSNQQVNSDFQGGACKCAHPGLPRLRLPSAAATVPLHIIFVSCLQHNTRKLLDPGPLHVTGAGPAGCCRPAVGGGPARCERGALVPRRAHSGRLSGLVRLSA